MAFASLDLFLSDNGIPAPSYGSTTRTTLRTRTIQFGDGYDESVVWGLNPAGSTYSVQWENLPLASGRLLHGFWVARGGAPFLWTPPMGEERKWRVFSIDGPPLVPGHELCVIAASFVETFDR